MIRDTPYFASRVIIAAVAALATGCAGPPVMVEEPEVPAAEVARKLTSNASQPANLTLRSASDRNKEAERLLLFWNIRKEGR